MPLEDYYAGDDQFEEYSKVFSEYWNNFEYKEELLGLVNGDLETERVRSTFFKFDFCRCDPMLFLLKYSGKGYGGEEARSRRAAAIANIEKMLEFAGHK